MSGKGSGLSAPSRSGHAIGRQFCSPDFYEPIFLSIRSETTTSFLSYKVTGVSLTAIGVFALVGTPYTMKYLWAPFIDRVPLLVLSKMLGRRRAWMLMIQFGLMTSIVALGLSNPRSMPAVTAFFALAVAFFSASQDIVIDAYQIEILDEDQHPDRVQQS